MAVSLVGTDTGYSGSNPSATWTYTFDTLTPTSGNLLVAFLAIRNGGDTFTTPSGDWTFISDAASGSFGCAWYCKISDGTETDIDWVWTDPGGSCCWVAEFTGNATPIGSCLEFSDEDETKISNLTATTHTIGTITPTGDGVAVAAHGDKWVADWTGTQTQPSGFTFEIDVFTTGAAPGAMMAYKVYTGTSALSGSFSTTDSGDACYGAVANFLEAAAGGGGFPAQSLLHRNQMRHALTR